MTCISWTQNQWYWKHWSCWQYSCLVGWLHHAHKQWIKGWFKSRLEDNVRFLGLFRVAYNYKSVYLLLVFCTYILNYTQLKVTDTQKTRLHITRKNRFWDKSQFKLCLPRMHDALALIPVVTQSGCGDMCYLGSEGERTRGHSRSWPLMRRLVSIQKGEGLGRRWCWGLLLSP